MIKDILSSDPFLTMAKTIIWWAVVALIVVLISYFAGFLSHPLVRARKRVSKFRVHSLSLSSYLKNAKPMPRNKKKAINNIRKLMLRKKSIGSALNVYIYDDKANNLSSGYSKNCIALIEDRLRHALSSIMEDDFETASIDLDESANIALSLYKRLQEVIAKEGNDRMWDI